MEYIVQLSRSRLLGLACHGRDNYRRYLDCCSVATIFCFAVKAIVYTDNWSLKRLLERIQYAKEEDVQHNGDCTPGFSGWLIAHSLLAVTAGRTGIEATCRNRQVVSRS